MPSNLPPLSSPSELRDRISDLTEQLRGDDSDILARAPIDRFTAVFQSPENAGPYNRVPRGAKDCLSAMRGRRGSAAVATYLKLALTTLLEESVRSKRANSLPSSIREELDRHWRLIDADLKKRPTAYFTLDNDLLLKDLAMLDGRMVPAGAQLLQLDCGVPRSLLTRGGLAQTFRFASFFASSMRGFVPYLEMHTDPRRMPEFTRAGWARFWVRAAELLEQNPDHRGVIGGSWWFDPAVPRLSPQLAFLHEPVKHGAAVFRFTKDPDPAGTALLRSPERQEAFEQGRYEPTVYIFIWLRDRLLRFVG